MTPLRPRRLPKRPSSPLIGALVALTLSALLLGAVACGDSGPTARLMDHQLAMLDLLEAHREDPPATAGAALSGYWSAHEGEIGELKAALDALPRDGAAFAELQLANKDRLRDFYTRERKLQRERPKLFTDPEVARVLAALKAL